MKVITVRQPWADLLAMGIKKVEFRSWRTHYRGRLAIHAGQTVDVAAREHFWRILNDPASIAREIPRVLVGEDLERSKGYLAHPRKGVVVAVARLASCDKSEYWYEELGFSEESWGWVFEDVMELKHEVRITGRQGLFTATPQDEAKIRAALQGPPALRLSSPTKKQEGSRIVGYKQVGRFKVPIRGE